MGLINAGRGRKGWLSGIRGGRFTGAADWCLPVNAHYPSTTVAAVAPAKSMVIDWKNPGKKIPDGRGFNELSVAVVTEPR